MKIPTEALRAALKTLAPAVLVNAQNPALASVKIVATEDGLTLSASDYQTWIETRVDGQPEVGAGEWQAMVSHRLANQIAGAVRAKEVTLEPEKNVVRFAAGKSYWLAPTISGDVPAVPEVPPVLLEVEAGELRAMVAKVAQAAASQPTSQPALHVVQVAADKAAVRFTATDRYRIHTVAADATGTGKKTTHIYPEAGSLGKVAAGLTGTVRLHATTESEVIALTDGATTVISRTIAVEKWLPIEANLEKWRDGVQATTTVPADVLHGAIKGAAAALNDDSTGVQLIISAEAFTVEASDEDSGARASADIEDWNHDGPALRAFLRVQLLLPILALAGEDPVELGWVRPDGAVIITIPGQAGTYVVMGLRVPGAGWVE